MSWRCSSGSQPSARVDVRAHWPGFLADQDLYELDQPRQLSVFGCARSRPCARLLARVVRRRAVGPLVVTFF